ncbi:MAG: hypothetical protein P4K80_05950 [Acidobacteriaceae bacterium]|nr:hypothetical protein [Acidobacteriaceae bacterium]
MTRCTLRSIFTVLIYAGVVIFLFPYLIGRLTHVEFYALVGLGLAAVSGILRCCFLEGDCTDRLPSRPDYRPPMQHHSSLTPHHR